MKYLSYFTVKPLEIDPGLSPFPYRGLIPAKELYRYEMEHECAMFSEDIIRRREAFDVYRVDRGASEREIIDEIMKNVNKSI